MSILIQALLIILLLLALPAQRVWSYWTTRLHWLADLVLYRGLPDRSWQFTYGLEPLGSPSIPYHALARDKERSPLLMASVTRPKGHPVHLSVRHSYAFLRAKNSLREWV